MLFRYDCALIITGRKLRNLEGDRMLEIIFWQYYALSMVLGQLQLQNMMGNMVIVSP